MEVMFWRDKLGKLERRNNHLEEENKRLEEERRQFEEKLKQVENENKKLRKEIAQLTISNDRYRISLFDHGNMKSLPSGDGKGPEEKEKKKRGGQTGHSDTNRESREDTTKWQRKRLWLSVCVQCGTDLSRVNGIREKQLIDIVLNPEVVKLILEQERQWCSCCKQEVSGSDHRSLPFTEYGMNIFVLTLILRYKCRLSLSLISSVYALLYGLQISKSSLTSMLAAASVYLKSTYTELLAAIKAGEVQYSDETGWMVKGKGAWMWVTASDNTVVYVAAESRGKGIATPLVSGGCGVQMTDGLTAYNEGIPSEKRAYCWAHMLRFAFEETGHDPPDSGGVQLRDELVAIYHLIHERDQCHPQYFYTMVRQKLATLIAQQVQEKGSSHARIRTRLTTQADGLALALTATPNGTNNRAEQVLRTIAIMRTVSHGSDTYRGMEVTATNASVIQTFAQHYGADTPTQLQDVLRIGISLKHPYFAVGES